MVEAICTSPRKWGVWLSWPERVLLALLVLGVLAVNALNIHLSLAKLLSARSSPVIAIEPETITTLGPLRVLACSPVPGVGFALDSLLCEYSSFELDGSTVQTLGPCTGLRALTVAQYECVLVPVVNATFVLTSGGSFVSWSFMGSLATCAASPAACRSDETYFQFAPVRTDLGEEEQAFAQLADLSQQSAVPLRANERTHVTFDAERRVNLAGESVTKLNPRLANLGSLVDLRSGPMPNVSFAVTINDLSMPTTQLVYTERVSYDWVDFVSAVAAVGSLTLGVMKIVFPSSPTVPVHFRFGRFAAYRRLGANVTQLATGDSLGMSTSKVEPIVAENSDDEP